MKLKQTLSLLFAVSVLQGCGLIKPKSVPWPTSVAMHDREALDHMGSAPMIDADLGAGLEFKDMREDGRLIGLSVSGGGARAAAFTLGVLSELQTITASDGTTALDRIDFSSSNSGGGWGIAAYLLDRAASPDPAGYVLGQQKERFTSIFVELSDGKVKCWEDALAQLPNGDMSFGELYAPDREYKLPRAYFNAALLPAQVPFVFTDSFLDHYKVTGFGVCPGKTTNSVESIAQLPVTYAASVSGAVPAWYHAFASTRLCETTSDRLSFCHKGLKGGPRSYLRIADGGLYDNIGYKTSFELFYSEVNSDFSKRSMIIVNSNPAISYQTVAERDIDAHFLGATAKNGLFAVQDSTFERLFRPVLRGAGVEDVVLLDFLSASGFQETDMRHLDGLDFLTFKAAYGINCFDGDRQINFDAPFPKDLTKLQPAQQSADDLAQKPGDCLSENFYRTGTFGKTTFKSDPIIFRILWELGQLSVRMNRDDVLKAVN